MAICAGEVATVIQWLISQSGMREIVRRPATCVVACTTVFLSNEMS